MIRVESLNRLPPSSSSATAACLEIERLRKMWRSNFVSYGRDQVDDSILAVIAVLSGADSRKLVRSPLFARSRGVEIFLGTAAYSAEVVRCHGKTKSDN